MIRIFFSLFFCLSVSGKLMDSQPVDSWAEKMIPSIIEAGKNASLLITNSVLKEDRMIDIQERAKIIFERSTEKITTFESGLKEKLDEVLLSLIDEKIFSEQIKKMLNKLNKSIDEIRQRLISDKLLSELLESSTSEKTLLHLMLESIHIAENEKCETITNLRQKINFLYAGLIVEEIKTFDTRIQFNVWRHLSIHFYPSDEEYEIIDWDKTMKEKLENLKKWKDLFNTEMEESLRVRDDCKGKKEEKKPVETGNRVDVNETMKNRTVDIWAEKTISTIIMLANDCTSYLRDDQRSQQLYEFVRDVVELKRKEILAFESHLDKKFNESLISLQNYYQFPKQIQEILTQLNKTIAENDVLFSPDTPWKVYEGRTIFYKYLNVLLVDVIPDTPEVTLLNSMLNSFKLKQDENFDEILLVRRNLYAVYDALVVKVIKAFYITVMQHIFKMAFTKGKNYFGNWNEKEEEIMMDLKKWKNLFQKQMEPQIKDKMYMNVSNNLNIDSWASQVVPSIVQMGKEVIIPTVCPGNMSIKDEDVEEIFEKNRDEIRKFEMNLKGRFNDLLKSLRNEYNFSSEGNEVLSKLSESILQSQLLYLAPKIDQRNPEDNVTFFKILGALTDENTNLPEKTILNSMLKSFQLKEDYRCDTATSSRQQLYLLYKFLVVKEIKGFFASVEQNVLRYLHNFANFSNTKHYNTFNFDAYAKKFLSNLGNWREVFKNATKDASNIIRRCDPTIKQLGTTYAEISGLNYAFVANITDFEEKGKQIFCSTKCSSIFKSRDDCPVSSSCNLPYRKMCPGQITCSITNSNYEVCESNKNSTRHYEWIKNLASGESFGNSSQKCHAETKKYPDKLIQRFGKQCRACMCMCKNDDITLENQTIRAISYMSSETDWKNNKVAIGAKLTVKDRMIHIQLQEGELLPNGMIKNGSEAWIPLPTFEYENNFPNKVVNRDGTKRPLVENVDYGLVNLEKNKIYLDDLSTPHGHVITGVRFIDYKINISYSKIDFKIGKIISDEPRDEYLKNSSEFREYYRSSRQVLVLNEPDNPLKLKETIPDSVPNQLVKIGVSDKFKDASQSIIPFFDLLEVTTNVPLSGIGLFHKGRQDLSSGGYISLRIYPLHEPNYSEF